MQLYLYTTRVGQLSKTFWVDPVCNYLYTARVGQLSKTFWVCSVCDCTCMQQGLDSCPRHFGLVLYATVFVFNKDWTVVQDILGCFCMQLYLYTTRIGQLSKTFWVVSVCNCTCIQQGLDSCPRHFGLVLYATVFVFNKGWTVVQDILGCFCMQLYLYTTKVGQLSKTFWVDPVCNCSCIQEGLDSCPRHFGLILYATILVYNKGWTVVQDILG